MTEKIRHYKSGPTNILKLFERIIWKVRFDFTTKIVEMATKMVTKCQNIQYNSICFLNQYFQSDSFNNILKLYFVDIPKYIMLILSLSFLHFIKKGPFYKMHYSGDLKT